MIVPCGQQTKLLPTRNTRCGSLFERNLYIIETYSCTLNGFTSVQVVVYNVQRFAKPFVTGDNYSITVVSCNRYIKERMEFYSSNFIAGGFQLPNI